MKTTTPRDARVDASRGRPWRGLVLLALVVALGGFGGLSGRLGADNPKKGDPPAGLKEADEAKGKEIGDEDDTGGSLSKKLEVGKEDGPGGCKCRGHHPEIEVPESPSCDDGQNSRCATKSCESDGRKTAPLPPGKTLLPNGMLDPRITNASVNEWHPAMAIDTNGKIFIAYQYDYSGTDRDIYVARSTDNGNTWAITALNTSTYDDTYPAICCDLSTNALYVTYTDNQYFKFAKSTDSGGTWTTYAVSSYTWWPSEKYPSVAAHGDKVWIFTQHAYSSSDDDIRYIRSANGGSSWFGPTTLVNSTKNERYPSVAMTSSRVGVSYQYEYSSTDQDVKYAYNNNHTSDTWFGITIAGSSVNERWPSIAASGNAAYLYVGYTYAYSTSDDDIRAAYSTNGGTAFGATGVTVAASGSNERYPSMGIDPVTPTKIHASYYTANGPHIERAYSTNNGVSWTAYIQATDQPNAVDNFHTTAMAARNYPRVGWEDSRNQGTAGYDIWFSAPGQTYTFASSPTGRTVTVDGSNYTAPVSFSWPAGYIASVSVPDPQVAGTTRYPWSSWSDGSAKSHTITVTDAGNSVTVTANFATQYEVTAGAATGAGGDAMTASNYVTAWSNGGYRFEDISGSGTEITSWFSVDDGFAVSAVNIGFTFPYYGGNFTQFVPATNGYVGLGNAAANHFAQYNQTIPPDLGASPWMANTVYPFSSDLYWTSGTSHVYYQSLTNPTRLVIQYKNIDTFDPRGTLHNFETILYDTGEVKFQYQTIGGTIVPDDVGLMGPGSGDYLADPSTAVSNGIAYGFQNGHKLYDGTSYALWVDSGASYFFSNPSRQTTSTERWQTNQSLSYTATAAITKTLTYWNQLYDTFSASTSSGGNLMTLTNHIVVVPPQYGGVGPDSKVWDGTNASDWCDRNSNVTFAATSTGSTSTERWQANAAGTNPTFTVTSSTTFSQTYWNQLYETTEVTTAAGGNAMTSGNFVSTTRTAFSSSGSGGNVWDGTHGTTWCDRASTVTFSATSSGSTSAERWQYNAAGTSPSFSVTSSTNFPATYWHQLYDTFSASTASGGDVMTGSNFVATTRFQFGASGSGGNLWDATNVAQWCDCGSNVTFAAASSASSGTERWQANAGGTSPTFAVTSSTTFAGTYFDQLYDTFSVSTAAGDDPLSSTNYVSVTRTAFAASGSGGNIWDGQTATGWCDRASTVAFSGLSSASTSTSRWLSNPDASDPTFSVTSSTTFSATYHHEVSSTWSVTTAPGGTPLTSSNYITTTRTQFGVTGSGPNLWDGHDGSDWGDEGTTVTFSAVSTGSDGSERWQANADGSAPSFVVTSSGGNYSATYFNQLHDTFSASTASGGDALTSSNSVSVTRVAFGTSGSAGSIWDGSNASDWCDRASAATYAASSSGSSSTERWQANAGGTSPSFTVTSSTTFSASYYDQLYDTFSVSTAAGGDAMTSSNFVAVTRTAFGGSGSGGTIWDGSNATDWCDRSSSAAFAATSSGSGSSERWQENAGGTQPTFSVTSSTTFSASYWNQLSDTFSATTAAGGDATTSTNYVRTERTQFGVTAFGANVWDGQTTTEWCDRGSTALLGSASSGSTSTERWRVNAAGSSPSFPVTSSTTFSATYWNQLFDTFNASTAAGEDPMSSSNNVSVTRTAFGGGGSGGDIWDGQTSAAWCDRASSVTFSAASSGSTATERWQANAAGTPPSFAVISSEIFSATYHHQFSTTWSVSTVAGGDAMISANHVTTTRTQFGVSGSGPSLWDGNGASDWGDQGTSVTFSAASSGSGSSERWRYDAAGTQPSFTVASGGTFSATYTNQLYETFSVSTASGGNAMTATNLVSVSRTSFGGNGAGGDIWDGSDASDWCDRASTVTFSAASSGSGASERWQANAGGTPPSFSATSSTTLSATYWNQLYDTFSVFSASGGDAMTATNSVSVTRIAFGGSGLGGNVWDGNDATDWCDRGSTATFGAASSASDASERWQANVAGTSPSFTVTSSDTLSVVYWDQMYDTFSVMTAAGGDAMTASNLIAVTRTAFGAGGSGGSAWDGSNAADWCDRASNVLFSATSSGSGPSERWRANAGGTQPIFTVTSSTTYSATYWNQLLPVVTLNGTSSSITTSTEAHKQFGTDHLDSAIYTSWSDWADRGSTLTFAETTSQGSSTTDTRTFSVSAAFTATITYSAPAPPGQFTIVSGNNQTVAPNTPVPQPFVVNLRDSDLNPVPNWAIVFRSETGGGHFQEMPGIIRTFTGGSYGGGGPATQAFLSSPVGVRGVAVSQCTGSGNPYVIVLQGAHRILKVDENGVVQSVVGTGSAGFGGDDGPAEQALLHNPAGTAFDAAGNLYIADMANQRIRRVDAASGIITTVAGHGLFDPSENPGAGDGGPATDAFLSNPGCLDVMPDGDIIFGDTSTNRVRRVDSETGIISNFAGGGSTSPDVGGLATSIDLPSPESLFADSTGVVYIGMFGRICRVDTNGILTAIAGTGVAGYSGDEGPATLAAMRDVFGLAISPDGDTLFLSDSGNNALRKIDLATGVISRVAGAPPDTSTDPAGLGTVGYAGDGCCPTCALMFFPRGMAFRCTGTLLFVDSGNFVVREVALGVSINTVAGSGIIGDNGPLTGGRFASIESVTGDGLGNIYVADQRRVRRIDRDGLITTYAGNGKVGFSPDGSVASASAVLPTAVAADAVGNVYYTEGNRVRKISTSGILSTVAGSGTAGFSGDGGLATAALLNSPGDLASDATGNLYVWDRLNERVRMVTASTGIVQTVAGGGSLTPAEGLTATSVAFGDTLMGVAVGPAGSFYLSSFDARSVYKVDAAGVIHPIGGVFGEFGYDGDDGPATSAHFNRNRGLDVDAAGNIYIADSVNHAIRRIDVVTGIITRVAGAAPDFSQESYGLGTPGFSGDGGLATDSLLSHPLDLWTDPQGNLYIADSGNLHIRRVASGSASSVLAATDASGTATAPQYVTGDVQGSQSVSATAPGTSAPPLIFAEIGPGPARLEIISGTPQEGVAGLPIQFPFVTRVLDADNNPLTGQVVRYEITEGTANFAGQSSAEVPTDAGGTASSPILIWLAGLVRVQATLPGTDLSPLDFWISENWTPGLVIYDRPGAQWFTNSSQITITGRLLELHPTSLTVNGSSIPLPGPLDRGAFSTDISLVDGANPVEIRAEDFYGAIRVRSFTIIRDTTPPVLTIDTPDSPMTTTNLENIVLRGSVDDPTATIFLEGAAFPVAPNGSFYVTVTPVNDRSDYRILAADKAGNTPMLPLEYSFVPTEPRLRVSLNAAPRGAGVGQSVTFSVQVDVGISIAEVYFDFDGDGAIDVSSNDLSVTHSYAAAGRYRATVLAETTQGPTTSAVLEITVSPSMAVLASAAVPGAQDLEVTDKHTFVLCKSVGEVRILNGNMAEEQRIMGDGLNQPEGIGLGNGEEVFIADTGNNRVQKWSKPPGCDDYHLDPDFGNAGNLGLFGSGDGEFNSPRDLVQVDQSLYVLDSGNGRIQVLDAVTGAFQESFGSPGTAEGEISSPTQLIFGGPFHALTVCEPGLGRLSGFDLDGTFLGTLGPTEDTFTLSAPVSAGNDAAFLESYLLDSASGRILVLGQDRTLSRQGAGFGLQSPTRIEGRFGAANRQVVVVDAGNERLVAIQIPEEADGPGPTTIWDSYRAALAAGDIEQAVGFYLDREQVGEREALEALEPDLSSYVGDLAPVTLKSIGIGGATCSYFSESLARTVDVYFVRSSSGWKIRGETLAEEE